MLQHKLVREPLCTSNSHKLESDKSLITKSVYKSHSISLPEVNVLQYSTKRNPLVYQSLPV